MPRPSGIVGALKKRRDQFLSFPDKMYKVKKKVMDLKDELDPKKKKKKLAKPGK